MANNEYVLSHAPEGPERERLVSWNANMTRYRSGIWQRWEFSKAGAAWNSEPDMGLWRDGWPSRSVRRGGWWQPTSIRASLLRSSFPTLRCVDMISAPIPWRPAPTDLVHCRAVLSHVPEPHPVVRRMVAALRVGGWLLVEDGDFSSIRAVDAKHPFAAFFNQKTREIFERSVANLYLGCQVRGLTRGSRLDRCRQRRSRPDSARRGA